MDLQTMGLLCLLFLPICIGEELTFNNNGISMEVHSVRRNINGKAFTFWELFEGKQQLVSVVRSELNITCSAPFPLKWNITGYLREVESVNIRPHKVSHHSKDNMTFTLNLVAYFLIIEESSASSSTIACESVSIPRAKLGLDVFLPSYDATKPFVNSGSSLGFKNTTVLSCPTTDPRQAVSLEKDGTLVNPADFKARYNPRIGFVSESIFPPGNYRCLTDQDNVSLIEEAKSQTNEYFVNPRKPLLRQFSTETVVIECLVDNSAISTELQVANGNSDIIIVRNGSQGWYVSARDINANSVGTVNCVTGDGKRIWTWVVEFLEAPSMYLENYAGNVFCITSQGGNMMEIKRSISVVTCYHQDECLFLQQCFNNYTSCNLDGQKQFHSNETTRCYIPERGAAFPCVKMAYSQISGIVECSVNGLTKHWMFFNSLSPRKYEYGKRVSKGEILKMNDVPNKLYQNLTTTFFCQGSAFYYSEGIIFEMIYKNGSSTLMKETQNPSYESREKVFGINVLGNLTIKPNIDAIGIRCLATRMDSNKIDSVEKSFETKYLHQPQMNSKNISVTLNWSNKRLNCSAYAEPPPKYRWIRNNNTLNTGKEYLITTGQFGESILEFLQLGEELKGDYTCEAYNVFDFHENDVLDPEEDYLKSQRRMEENIASVDFFVSDVQRDSGNLKTHIILTVVIISLFTIIILLAVAFRSFYWNTKLLLRKLTDIEIDEFFQGNPILVLSLKDSCPSPELINQLPYDSKFEIDLAEITMDTNKLLGEGNFSLVIQGYVTSKKNFVAVKIPKNTVDINSFKALLTEIKIMIHIGEHANILKLVGASTKNIKDRCVHMVFEICEKGSLEHFLRSNRNDFRNDLDRDHEISRRSSTGVSNQCYENVVPTFSTVNLLQWCSEISCAMEFLSTKKVIHGDLASRNVLLTADLTAKVSDFGLSRQLYDTLNYTKKSSGPLPWRWMALESLETLKFSNESDIWSFGVTAWEIFTLGNIPYPSDTWSNQFVDRLKFGMRMGKPIYSNHEIYAKIAACWDERPEYRPQFQDITQFFTSCVRNKSWL